MFTAMSSWLESVMIAFAPCFFTRWSPSARACSGELPELASASSKRIARPSRLSAVLAVLTARRIESAQLGVAMEPVRSMTCPSTTTGIADAGGSPFLQLVMTRRKQQMRFIMAVLGYRYWVFGYLHRVAERDCVNGSRR